MSVTRLALANFMLANEIYRGCSVTVWKADVNGIKTAVKATLYDSPTGTGTLANPQILDGEGKFKNPVYIADPVVLEVSGLHVATHTTGMISPPGTWRGNWATATQYFPGDYFRDGAAGTNTQNVYVVQNYHTSGVWATDVADSTKMALVIDYVTLTGTVVPDATTSLKGKVELATNAETITGTDTVRAVTPDALAALWEDAGNVNNGATITLGDGGRFNLITSTVTITAFVFTTSKAGRRARCRANTVRQITHNATSLICQGGGNIVTAVGDTWDVVDLGSGNVAIENYCRADGTPLKVAASLGTAGQGLVSTGPSTPPTFQDTGKVTQVVIATYATYSSHTTAIPDDDTIPQNTEGEQIISQAFTPKNAGSTLLIEFNAVFFTSLTTNAAAALFKDSGADAIAATPAGSNTATFPKHLVLRHTEAAGSVSARTYKVRVGPATGTLYINGDASTRTYGGTRKCILTITEILP